MTASLTSNDPVLEKFAELVGTEGPVAVEGHRTRWNLGGRVDSEARLIKAPTGIVEYAPEEMTIVVRAGTAVAELHAELASSGQRTALPERGGTVGGALAVGENDFRALGRGLARTSLLLIRYISAEGRVINSGGPTVKNVSGFDLPRLMVGSLGTLGLIVEVTLRSNPIPAISRWMRADGVDPQAAHDALLAPSAVLWDGDTTWVEVEGHESDVEAQCTKLTSMGDFELTTGPPVFPDHRWSLAPSDMAALPEREIGNFVATIGLGLAFADTPQPPRPLTPAVAEVTRRLKFNFDPTGRLNPGRRTGGH